MIKAGKIITKEGEDWSNLPWYYGVAYDIHNGSSSGCKVVWLPIPLNFLVSFVRKIFYWFKTNHYYRCTTLDKIRLEAFTQGRRFEQELQRREIKNEGSNFGFIFTNKTERTNDV